MATNKPTPDKDKVGITPQRQAELDKELADSLAGARASEKKRREASGSGTDELAGVKFKPGSVKKKAVKKRASFVGGKTGVDPSTNVVKPVVEQTPEERRDTAEEAPKSGVGPTPKLKGPAVTPGRSLLRGRSIRQPKTREIQKGIVVAQTPKPKQGRKKAAKTVVRNPQTGRAEVAPPPTPTVTQLPTAGPGVMQERQVRQPLAPGAGVQRPQVFVDKTQPEGEQATRKLKGLPVPHKMLAPLVHKALGHLDQMGAARGTNAYHQHNEAFKSLHSQVLATGANDIHRGLAHIHHHTMYPTADSRSTITQIKSALSDRLAEGKQMEVQRAQRQRGK